MPESNSPISVDVAGIRGLIVILDEITYSELEVPISFHGFGFWNWSSRWLSWLTLKPVRISVLFFGHHEHVILSWSYIALNALMSITKLLNKSVTKFLSLTNWARSYCLSLAWLCILAELISTTDKMCLPASWFIWHPLKQLLNFILSTLFPNFNGNTGNYFCFASQYLLLRS